MKDPTDLECHISEFTPSKLTSNFTMRCHLHRYYFVKVNFNSAWADSCMSLCTSCPVICPTHLYWRDMWNRACITKVNNWRPIIMIIRYKFKHVFKNIHFRRLLYFPFIIRARPDKMSSSLTSKLYPNTKALKTVIFSTISFNMINDQMIIVYNVHESGIEIPIFFLWRSYKQDKDG